MDTNKPEVTSIPVRIDRDLYEKVSAVASDNRRKIRQQIEFWLEQALERMDAPAQLETRKGARRG